MVMANQNKNAQNNEKNNGHPHDFQVSGPRYLSTPSWREIIRSSWLDDSYKRKVMACVVQAAYLLEVDRQEKREGDAALAPKWWKFFKYRVVELLVDWRDGSIFGATFEWDRAAALGDLLFVKPYKASKTIIALRGTLLRGPTIRIDMIDDLRIFTKEDLSDSFRFHKTLEAVRSAVGKHGMSEVSMAGHSLGAGVALQVGRALALEGIFVETHLFNPPSVSLPLALRCVRDKFGMLFNVVKGLTILPFKRKRNNDKQSDDEKEVRSVKNGQQIQNWVPHLYVNCSDSICCYYSDYCVMPQKFIEVDDKSIQGMLEESGLDRVAVKVYVVPRGPKKFLEAHGMEQWWSHESEPLMVLNESTLIQHQLSSLIHLKNNLSS